MRIDTLFESISPPHRRYLAGLTAALLDHLLEGEVPEISHGICYNLVVLLLRPSTPAAQITSPGNVWADGLCRRSELACTLVEELSSTWPLRSGNPKYPVPGGPDSDPAWEYCRTKNLWVDAYGERRLDLVRHMRDELLTLLDGEPKP